MYTVAKNVREKGLGYKFVGRKLKKRAYRSLWIVRINAAARMCGISYSRLINGLDKAGVIVDRKMLADLAVHDMAAFRAIAEKAVATA